jgi:hypothetical protein
MTTRITSQGHVLNDPEEEEAEAEVLEAACVLPPYRKAQRWCARSATSAGEAGKSSLGDAKSSLGDAKSSLGDAKSSLGDAKSSLGDAKS